MKDFLKKAWNYFDGKKTNIAACLLAILKILSLCGVGIPPALIGDIELIIYGLLGLGLGHKGIKENIKSRNARLSQTNK